MWQESVPGDIASAMWAEDIEALQRDARCVCCCAEHTYAACPARHWNACRSGLSFGEIEEIEG